MRYVRSFLLALLFAFLGTSTFLTAAAQAQHPDSTSRHRTGGKTDVETEKAPFQEADLKRKDPGRAVLYSLGGTVALAPVFGIGLLVGPSFGHFYADNSAWAVNGILIRGGGVALGMTGVGMAWSNLDDAEILMALGGTVVLSSAIYDIAMAGESACQYNEAHGLKTQVRPTAFAAPTDDSRAVQVGLALTVQF